LDRTKIRLELYCLQNLPVAWVRKIKMAKPQAAAFGVPPFQQQTLNSLIYEDVFHAKIVSINA